VTRREFYLAAAAGLLLFAAAVLRVVTPDRFPIRRVSIEGVTIPSQPIAQGETIDRTAEWWPPTDVYLLAWEPTIGARGSGAELFLMVGETRVFGWQDGEHQAVTLSTRETPAGTGYLLRRGEAAKVWLRMTNTGPPGITHGARAYVYFVPVEGN
jgi:hypothetical protein